MFTLCACGNPEDAQQISDCMKKADPAGSHQTEQDPDRIMHVIGSAAPDIVWLDADEEGLAIAKEGHKRLPKANFILVAGGTEHAAEAMKLRASGYVIRPVTEQSVMEELDNLRYPVSLNRTLLRIQCFGNFEVFSNGKITRFSRSLSKEALAYMVDRRGAGCTVGEICSVLWENRPIDTNLKSQCRVILASLKKDLEAVGAGAVLVKGWNTWGIDTDRIECDYYDFLRSKGRAEESYRGEYMTQYSWAEMTSGTLYQMASE